MSGIEMFPSALTRVCSDRSGAPYTAISRSSPGPRTSAVAPSRCGLFCPEDLTAGWLTVAVDSWRLSCLGVWFFVAGLFCAEPSWSRTVTPTTSRDEERERKLKMRNMACRDFKPPDACIQLESREFEYIADGPVF